MTVVFVVAGSLVAFIALVAWLALRPGPPASHLRVRSAPPGSTCSTVDLELRLAASVAVVRTWRPVGDGSDRCVASARQGELTAEQLGRARAAAREVGEGGLLRSLALGERRPGRVVLELAIEGPITETTSSRSFDGLVPQGVAALEALYVELVGVSPAGTGPTSTATPAPRPGEASPAGGSPPGAWSIPVADPRRADLGEVLASLEAHASWGMSEPGLASMTVLLQRGGDVDLTTQAIVADYQSRNVRVAYRIDRGVVAVGPSQDRKEARPPAPSRCSSRDLWRKAIAAGMRDAASMRLTLVSGPRPEGGVKTLWAFMPVEGPMDHRLRFDAATCALEPT